MYRIWIHRSTAADIFVPINIDEAISFAKSVLTLHSPNTYELEQFNIDTLLINGSVYLGNSNNIQISLITETYVPAEGWEYWNSSGFIMATPEEAFDLGTSSEPEGFVAGESSIPWVKEHRTHAELDKELYDYMNQPTGLSHEQKYFLKTVYSMFV